MKESDWSATLPREYRLADLRALIRLSSLISLSARRLKSRCRVWRTTSVILRNIASSPIPLVGQRITQAWISITFGGIPDNWARRLRAFKGKMGDLTGSVNHGFRHPVHLR